MAGAKSSVEIGVTGIAAFKSAMNEAKAASKALDAEMKQNEAAFKAGGNAQEYMAQKTKLVKQAMTEQQTVITNAEKALAAMAKSGDTSSTAYQNMRAQLAQAKTAMIGLEQSADGVGGEMTETASDADKLAEAIGKIGNKVSFGNVLTVMKDIGNIAKNAVGAVIDFGKGIVKAANDAAQAADDFLTAANRYDMAVTELQKWQLAAKLMDADVDSIIKARTRILDDMMKSTNGVLVLDADTTKYDVAVKNANGSMRDVQDVFWDTVEALGAMEDSTKRDAKAYELFGRSYMEVKTLFQEGAREKWMSILNDAGANTESEWGRLGELNDELDKMRYNAQIAKYSALSGLAPAFETGAEAVNRFLERLTEFTRSEEAQKIFQGLADSAAAFFDSFTDEDIANFFTKLQTDILPSIGTFIEGLPEKVNSAVESIGGLSGSLEEMGRIMEWLFASTNGGGVIQFAEDMWAWFQGPDAWFAHQAEYDAEKAFEAALEWGSGRGGGGHSNGAGAGFSRSDVVAAAAEGIPDSAAQGITENMGAVYDAAYAMGSAMASGASAGFAANGGGNSYSNTNNNTFVVSNGVDAQAAADYINATSAQTMAGYGG